MGTPAPGLLARGSGVTGTRLRPARPEEQDLVLAWRDDPASEFDDFRAPDPDGRDAQLDAPPPGLGRLLVTDGADRPIGSVSWHEVTYGPNRGSTAVNIGIALRPEARGQGHGTRAQRMLADYLFTAYPVHRIEASTDVRNVAEQHALERAGFTREGVLREAQWRRGGWRDLVSYSRLRGDAVEGP